MGLLIPPIKDGDWRSVRQAIAKLASLKLGYDAIPTFSGLTLSGLTASRLIQTNASKVLTSVSDLTSWITGTTNQITVADDGDGTVTLATPQDIHIGASPTFADLTLSSPSNIYSLSHNNFADYVANEHIDWTDASENFKTSGTLSSGVITQSGDTLDNTYHPLTTVGIAQDNLVKVSATGVVNTDFARFTATGLEGLSAAEVLADLSTEAVSAFGWNDQNLFQIGTITANSDSETGLLIEHTGVKDNVLVVSTARGGVAIGTTVPADTVFKVLGRTGTVANTGQDITQIGGIGGIGASTNFSVGAPGGDFLLESGCGGEASASTLISNRGGSGGDNVIQSGDGGVAAGSTGSNTGGIGGVYAFRGGKGGDATGSTASANIGGKGAQIAILPGGGGDATNGGTNTGGDGADLRLSTGAFGTGATADGVDGTMVFFIGGTLAGDEIATLLADKTGLRFLDDKAVLFGTTNRGSIYHDGNDLIINPAFAGSGGVKILGDTFWAGDGTGLPYASCYGNDIAWTQVAVQNTWYNIVDSDMTTGELNLATHDGNGKLTLQKAGRYLITVVISTSSGSANKHMETGIEISESGSADLAGRSHYELIGVNNELEVTGTAIIDLAENATVEGAVRTTDGGNPTITVQHLNITIVQIGGT